MDLTLVSYLSLSCVVLGSGVMVLAIRNTGKLTALIKNQAEKSRWTILRTFMFFFLFGYAATGALLLTQQTKLVFFLLGLVFFFGAIFVFKTVQAGLDSVNSLEAVIAERTQDLVLARKEAEDAVEARTRFMANVSHEIRTPMNAVLGLTTLLLKTDLTDAQRADLMTLREASNVLLGVVTDVLDFAKIETNSFDIEEHPISLISLLKSVKAIWQNEAHQKGIALDFAIPEEFWPYWLGDKLRIQQILQNLIANAVRFTDSGSVLVEVSSASSVVTFVVSDTGAGIPTEDLELIFHSFRQSATDRGGTGLGLAICHRLCRAMGGELEVESQLEKGSKFTVTMPLRRIKEFEESDESLSDMTEVQHRVLLVDDNDVNLKVATRFLKKLGCDIETARNGQEALEKTESEKFDLILMDCQMPVMTGLEATKKIRARENGETHKIFALTAMATPTHLQECLDSGMDGYITKPVRLSKLRDVLLSLKSDTEQEQ